MYENVYRFAVNVYAAYSYSTHWITRHLKNLLCHGQRMPESGAQASGSATELRQNSVAPVRRGRAGHFFFGVWLGRCHDDSIPIRIPFFSSELVVFCLYFFTRCSLLVTPFHSALPSPGKSATPNSSMR